MPSVLFGTTFLTPGVAGNEQRVNDAVNRIEACAQIILKTHTTTAQPVSPADGDVHFVPSGATGAQWASQVGKIAIYFGGWAFVTPQTGWVGYLAATGQLAVWTGSTWSPLVTPVFRSLLLPTDVRLPASSPAVAATINDRAVLNYANVSTLYASWMAQSQSTGAITVDLYWTTTATSGDVRWTLETEVLDGGEVITSTVLSGTTAVSGTASGVASTLVKTSFPAVTPTLAAGSPFRIRIGRLGSDAADTCTGTASLLYVGVNQ